MAIICGIVQLFDHIFFSRAATTLSQIFLQIVAFPFFFYFTEQFLGGFFSVILSFLSYAVCQTGGKLELVLNVPQKTQSDLIAIH